jgi:hypothetical protein
MRLMMMGLLTAGLATVACNHTDASTPAGNALVTPATAPADRTPAASAVAATARPHETGGLRGADGGANAWREVVIPAGTNLAIVLDTAVGSATSRVEAPVSAHLSRPITVHGRTALEQGSRVSGVVTDAKQAGKVKGLAHVAVRFDTLLPSGDDQRYTIHTSAIGRTAAATKKDDALKIGAPAAGGAVIGALIGGKKGALIGGAAGGGAGTAVVLSTRGKEISLPKGAALTLRLTQPVTVRIKS